MRNFLLMFFLLIVTFVNADLWAQKITVTARLDSTVLWIGDQARLSFEVTQQANQKVSMPIFSDTIVGGLDLVERLKADTVKSTNGHILIKQSYVVTAFEDSLLYIPPFPFIYNGDTVWSKSLSLKVVQPFKIDTASNSLADIKPVFNTRYDWVGLIKLILLVLISLALLVFLYYILRKYIQKKPIFVHADPLLLLSPYEAALIGLDKIKQEKPWQQGRFKEYHTELTDVIRVFMEREFKMKRMEMTSE